MEIRGLGHGIVPGGMTLGLEAQPTNNEVPWELLALLAGSGRGLRAFE